MKLFSRSKNQGPRTATITGTNKAFEVPGKDSILNEALAAGIPFPHSCTVGTCGTCKSKLVHGRVREIVDSAIALTAQELRDGYILPCQSIARTSIELDVAGLADMPEHPLVHTGAVISAHRALTHDIAEIVVALDHDLEYTAGQYAELRMDGLTGPRSYSFATAPDDADRRRATFTSATYPEGNSATGCSTPTGTAPICNWPARSATSGYAPLSSPYSASLAAAGWHRSRRFSKTPPAGAVRVKRSYCSGHGHSTTCIAWPKWTICAAAGTVSSTSAPSCRKSRRNRPGPVLVDSSPTPYTSYRHSSCTTATYTPADHRR